VYGRQLATNWLHAKMRQKPFSATILKNLFDNRGTQVILNVVLVKSACAASGNLPAFASKMQGEEPSKNSSTCYFVSGLPVAVVVLCRPKLLR
jgi:hypothetical protein